MKLTNAVLTALAAAAMLVLFSFAADGLRIYFTGGDLMKPYGYWTHPVSQIVKEAIVFYPAEIFRPLGAVFYLPLFKHFGLNPLPYRVVSYVLLLANLGLLYLFCL